MCLIRLPLSIIRQYKAYIYANLLSPAKYHRHFSADADDDADGDADADAKKKRVRRTLHRTEQFFRVTNLIADKCLFFSRRCRHRRRRRRCRRHRRRHRMPPAVQDHDRWLQ